jgi:regulatory protein YycH of two-component signal transduction system YycFG
LKHILLIVLIGFAGCKNKDHSKDSESYFKTEIAGRIEKIDQLDSNYIDPHQIDSEINKFILLSKDIENLSASINRSTHFFDTLSVKYQLNRADFTNIDKSMTLDQMAMVLKGNELNLFNQILFKNNKGESLMYTAQ